MNPENYPESSHFVNRRQSAELRPAKYMVLRWLGFDPDTARVLRDYDKRMFTQHAHIEIWGARSAANDD